MGSPRQSAFINKTLQDSPSFLKNDPTEDPRLERNIKNKHLLHMNSLPTNEEKLEHLLTQLVQTELLCLKNLKLSEQYKKSYRQILQENGSVKNRQTLNSYIDNNLGLNQFNGNDSEKLIRELKEASHIISKQKNSIKDLRSKNESIEKELKFVKADLYEAKSKFNKAKREKKELKKSLLNASSMSPSMNNSPHSTYYQASNRSINTSPSFNTDFTTPNKNSNPYMNQDSKPFKFGAPDEEEEEDEIQFSKPCISKIEGFDNNIENPKANTEVKKPKAKEGNSNPYMIESNDSFGIKTSPRIESGSKDDNGWMQEKEALNEKVEKLKRDNKKLAGFVKSLLEDNDELRKNK